MWDEITYPFPNFKCATVKVKKWISNSIPHFTGHATIYPCWDLKLTHVSKRGHKHRNCGHILNINSFVLLCFTYCNRTSVTSCNMFMRALQGLFSSTEAIVRWVDTVTFNDYITASDAIKLFRSCKDPKMLHVSTSWSYSGSNMNL